MPSSRKDGEEIFLRFLREDLNRSAYDGAAVDGISTGIEDFWSLMAVRSLEDGKGELPILLRGEAGRDSVGVVDCGDGGGDCGGSGGSGDFEGRRSEVEEVMGGTEERETKERKMFSATGVRPVEGVEKEEP